jgi:hypothetical protein
MKKIKNSILITSILIILISTTILIYFKYIQKDGNENSSYYLELDSNYVKNDTWEYTITGLLPNSCYTYSIIPITPDTKTETIYIIADISIESSETCIPSSCEQTIEAKGFFNGSESAKIEFIYDKIE